MNKMKKKNKNEEVRKKVENGIILSKSYRTCDYSKGCEKDNNHNDNDKINKKNSCLFIRKEIFDHAIIYTTNKMDENNLLIYLKHFYQYFKKENINKNINRNRKYLNDEIYITLNDWIRYNELIMSQENNIHGNIFTINICKSIWILLSITVQSVRKKNNSKNQKTIFNTPFEDLHIHKYNHNDKKKKNESDDEVEKTDKYVIGKKNKKEHMKEKKKDNFQNDYHKLYATNNLLNNSQINHDNIKNSDCGQFEVWVEDWLNEEICIELVIFFIIIQLLKNDNTKKMYDKSLSEDCWPNIRESKSSVLHVNNVDNINKMENKNNVDNNNIVSNLNHVSNMNQLNNINHVSNLHCGHKNNSNCSFINKSNLCDFFQFNGNNYKEFLRRYLICFFCCTDINNSINLMNMPLYFKRYHFLLLDFILETNNKKNVHEMYLLYNDHKILYKSNNILDWLLDNICCYDLIDSINNNKKLQDIESSSICYVEAEDKERKKRVSIYSVEEINKDIYEIKDIYGKNIYINDDKNIVNIINCKECNIFFFCTIEYLKINFCDDCYIICLSVEMITTLFNCINIDIHLVTRNLKVENVIDTNIFVYTETNIIIFGDTRNIQLAPYNILNTKQKECLKKSKISFTEKNCDLFAFPLKCKLNLLNNSFNNLINTKKPPTYFSILSMGNDKNKVTINKENNTQQNDNINNININNINNNNNNKCVSFNCINDISHSLRDNKKNESFHLTNKCIENTNNLSCSYTDYVYYLLNPSNFFLIEFSNNFSYNSKKDIKEDEEYNVDNIYNKLNMSINNVNNIQDNINKYISKEEKSIYGCSFENICLQPHMSNYINKTIQDSSKNNLDDKYVCLYLPEVYKNAIETQDEHIINFLNFMNSINLTKIQKQKIMKILMFKLYEYIKRSKKTYRMLNNLVQREHEGTIL
ncbi:conserved Plasmodium protein, unknown function [Plasmodium sp. DRC-Itaito]|nr:conserved Plasmodium protein, unknown function [Plasmodium sp. DRC-Itaito]